MEKFTLYTIHSVVVSPLLLFWSAAVLFWDSDWWLFSKRMAEVTGVLGFWSWWLLEGFVWGFGSYKVYGIDIE